MKKIFVPALLLLTLLVFGQTVEKALVVSSSSATTVRNTEIRGNNSSTKVQRVAPASNTVEKETRDIASPKRVAGNRVKPSSSQIDYSKPEEKK